MLSASVQNSSANEAERPSIIEEYRGLHRRMVTIASLNFPFRPFNGAGENAGLNPRDIARYPIQPGHYLNERSLYPPSRHCVRSLQDWKTVQRPIFRAPRRLDILPMKDRSFPGRRSNRSEALIRHGDKCNFFDKILRKFRW